MKNPSYLKLIAFLGFLMISACCSKNSNFETLATGTKYLFGSSLTSNNMDFYIEPFVWSNNVPTKNGFAEIGSQNLAGGSGKEMTINNINLAFAMRNKANSLSFDVGFYGGNMNLGINGVLHNFTDVPSINGLTIAGVTISAAGSHNNPGRWEFNGQIDSFYVGGQEFAIDNICIKE